MAGCPSCDRDLSAPGQYGHKCYTYAEHVAKQLANQGNDTVLRTFDPAATRVMAEAARAAADSLAESMAGMRDVAREVGRRYSAWLAGLPLVLSRYAEHGMVVDGTVVLPQHSLEAEAAMSAELVACTLGQRQRPELVPAPPFA